MPTLSVQEFLDQGERSGLFTADAARAALAPQTLDGAMTTDNLASRLVEKNVITAFQAEHLLAGRAKECVIAGRYRVLEKLGAGGMGTVYQACDTKLDRIVALKVLPEGRLGDTEAVARFQREAKALARLSHPHIIQAYDSGDDNGRHFLVMEFVAGVTLDKVLRAHGALAPTLAADLVYQTALGLQHAHEKELVHRDLKPANLLVAGLVAPRDPHQSAAVTVDFAEGKPLKPASNAVVKLLDLGLARFLQDQIGDSQLTQEGAGMGTPDYMAPEQFRDAAHADARTDIYGLGCTLYHLIAGQVPFPGSSFSDKSHAHAKKEPIPLEERCPEIPTGLAFVVSKMMAKHPKERYQTAREVAEALAPFVAGASHSVIQLRQTGKWPPGQATMIAPRPVRRALTWVGGAAAAVVFVTLSVLAWPALFPPAQQVVPPEPKPPDPIAGPDKKPPEPPLRPVVVKIANGLTVAQDGTGELTSIQTAIDKIQPGQTIRVLDNAIYKEKLLINRPTNHAGITLEATNGATISFPEGKLGVSISSVPRVTIRGFRFRHEGKLLYMMGVGGNCQGVHLDGLDFHSSGEAVGAVTVESVVPSGDLTVIENCTVSGEFNVGLRVSGYTFYTSPSLCGNVVIRNNKVTDASMGILLSGAIKDAHVTGNRVAFCRRGGIQLENLLPGANDILVANNTMFDCTPNFRFWNDAKMPLPERITIANNLSLGSQFVDMIAIDSRGTPDQINGPGNGKALIEKWTWKNNVREFPGPPSGTDNDSQGWIPIAAADQRLDKVDLVNRDHKYAEFLHIGKESELARGGAGGSFPTWVGAAPPTGETWDWKWTWDALVHKRITVSQKKEDGGRFRTITDALKAAGPRMTVRVLDDAVYPETLSVTRATQHEGLTLEAVRRATIAPAKANVAVGIYNVPNVTVRGFRMRADAEGVFLFGIVGKSVGACLEDLETDKKESVNWYRAVSIENVNAAPDDPPVVVQNCTFQRTISGIRVSGMGADYKSSNPVRGVLLQNNRLVDPGVGIILLGSVKNVFIVGNRINGASLSAIQLENLMQGTQDILIANNTIFECTAALRLRDDLAKKDFGENVQIRNNLSLDANGLDMWFVNSGGHHANDKGPGDGKSLQTKWTFSHNWRENKAAVEGLGKEWIPPAATDKLVAQIDGLSRSLSSPDFHRPQADSPLATGGAGGDLPSYVGALPPAKVGPWDWMKTWKARAR